MRGGVIDGNTSRGSGPGDNEVVIMEVYTEHSITPIEQSAQRFATWRSNQVSPPQSPVTGYMAPMADVASSSWAQYTAQFMHVQHGLMEQAAQQGVYGPKAFPTPPITPGSGKTSPGNSGRTTPKERGRKRKREDETTRSRQVHGDRVLAAAGAHMLWLQLDEPSPQGTENPEEGASASAIEAAKRGRENVKLSLEVSTARAQERWLSQTRSKRAHGGQIEELYTEYEDAVSAYTKRHRAARMQ